MGRKQAMMPMMNGSGAGRRVVGVLVGLVLLGLVLRDPVGAAGTVRQAASWVGSVLDALTSFGSTLAK
ncbi:hypothetical protein Lesp02_85380 [Lentzea sp. NBRC 105346]|uniref:hypothetical protein n=1 Tax=Lentzea sp. NBRC 105346 TaxID=3032205 RepID=UPI0024A2F989|nr:hypothetical protein [Lentzea sp. NBRC 105346]GLZ36351.1 hypothetical protein Lesp02_85380 [Lentzea sp. NBRC 105346]